MAHWGLSDNSAKRKCLTRIPAGQVNLACRYLPTVGQNLRCITKEKEARQRTIFVLLSAEASIAFVWTSAYAGAQTFAVYGALPHTLFFLNFLITPRFWYSYSLPFPVLCVAE